MQLLERRNGKVVAVTYKGVWIVVDNGYHNWSTTVPPFTRTGYQDEIRWSEWLESMRKDVECTFGILKGRWRILKTGVRLHDTASVDKIWLTCCALHNMRLEVDGLDKEWDGVGVPTSAYLGELGEVLVVARQVDALELGGGGGGGAHGVRCRAPCGFQLCRLSKPSLFLTCSCGGNSNLVREFAKTGYLGYRYSTPLLTAGRWR